MTDSGTPAGGVRLGWWGSDCDACGNATPGSMFCDECGSDERTVRLYREETPRD